jgi:hypothetical protein
VLAAFGIATALAGAVEGVPRQDSGTENAPEPRSRTLRGGFVGSNRLDHLSFTRKNGSDQENCSKAKKIPVPEFNDHHGSLTLRIADFRLYVDVKGLRFRRIIQ